MRYWNDEVQQEYQLLVQEVCELSVFKFDEPVVADEKITDSAVLLLEAFEYNYRNEARFVHLGIRDDLKNGISAYEQKFDAAEGWEYVGSDGFCDNAAFSIVKKVFNKEYDPAYFYFDSGKLRRPVLDIKDREKIIDILRKHIYKDFTGRVGFSFFSSRILGTGIGAADSGALDLWIEPKVSKHTREKAG